MKDAACQPFLNVMQISNQKCEKKGKMLIAKCSDSLRLDFYSQPMCHTEINKQNIGIQVDII